MKNSKAHGFSLVEVIIALSLVGALTVMLSSSWWLLIRLNEHLADKDDLTADLQDRLRLQRFLESIVSTDFTDEFELITELDTTTLTAWVSPGGFAIPGAETDPCRLILQTENVGGVSVRIQPMSFTDSSDELNDLKLTWHSFQKKGRCTFDIMGRDGRWFNDWPVATQRGLPLCVRLRFPDSEISPEILARVHAAGDCHP